ncbi:MAG: hypothetical protein ACSLE2_02455 [Lysobacterales bacterium]
MKNGLLSLVLLAAFLAGGSVLGQDWEVVVEPQMPNSHERIKITIPNTACYVGREVEEALQDRVILIKLTFYLQYIETCLAENPDAPDFSTTIGPVAAGDYVVVFTQVLEGRVHRIAAEKSFTVTQAPPAQALLDGGINGFYYNPAADGHYVYILETDFTTLVTWNTFDADGNQAWIFGTGKLENGKAVVADAYVNHSDGYWTDGRLKGLEVVRWGTLEVEMQSCWDGTVTYQSELPGFGSGQFPIRRLAFAKQIGCAEAD